MTTTRVRIQRKSQPNFGPPPRSWRIVLAWSLPTSGPVGDSGVTALLLQLTQSRSISCTILFITCGMSAKKSPNTEEKFVGCQTQTWRAAFWFFAAASDLHRSGFVAIRRSVGCSGNMERRVPSYPERSRSRQWWSGNRSEAELREPSYNSVMDSTSLLEDWRGVDVEQIRRQLRLTTKERVRGMVHAANVMMLIRENALAARKRKSE